MIRRPGLAARRRVGADDENDRVGGGCHLTCGVDAAKILAPVRQSHLVGVPIAAIGDADSLRGHYLHALAHLGTDSVQDADSVRRHVRVAAQLSHRGIGADHRQCLQRVRVQRQHAIVLQQDDRLAGRLGREHPGFGIVCDLLG